MRTRTIDINDVHTSLRDLVNQAVEGAQVVLSENDKPVAQIVPVGGGRVAGLHPGSIWTSEDFDAPLPDEFWTNGK